MDLSHFCCDFSFILFTRREDVLGFLIIYFQTDLLTKSHMKEYTVAIILRDKGIAKPDDLIRAKVSNASGVVKGKGKVFPLQARCSPEGG